MISFTTGSNLFMTLLLYHANQYEADIVIMQSFSMYLTSRLGNGATNSVIVMYSLGEDVVYSLDGCIIFHFP